MCVCDVAKYSNKADVIMGVCLFIESRKQEYLHIKPAVYIILPMNVLSGYDLLFV